jgi:hypothetical protein
MKLHELWSEVELAAAFAAVTDLGEIDSQVAREQRELDVRAIQVWLDDGGSVGSQL